RRATTCRISVPKKPATCNPRALPNIQSTKGSRDKGNEFALSLLFHLSPSGFPQSLTSIHHPSFGPSIPPLVVSTDVSFFFSTQLLLSSSTEHLAIQNNNLVFSFPLLSASEGETRRHAFCCSS